MSSNRYFLSSPEPTKYFSPLSSVLRTMRKMEAILLMYAIAFFSLYWFLWRPAYILEPATFKYSPTLFFAALWVIISASGIGYAMWQFVHSTRMADEINEETNKLGEWLYKIESDLQEQLERVREENQQSYLNQDHESSEGTEILSQKYDALLE